MNIDEASAISMLLLKQLREGLSPEEELTWQQWLRKSRYHQQLWEEFADEDLFRRHLQAYTAIRRAGEYSGKEVEAVRTPVVRSSWFRFVAAACILLLLSAAAYLLFRPAGRQLSTTDNNKQPTNNIPAGRDGAVLTLSDGTQIVLDSAANGQLAQEGKATITHKDGQISYQGSGLEKGKLLYNTTSTPRGRQYRLQLVDGTNIWLNAASSVTYPTEFTGNKREITITGEVYLEVRPSNKPFIVHIAHHNTDIEVVGTRFAVNAYADEPYVRTTLLAGAVQLTTQVQGKSTRVLLRPGNQIKSSHENLEFLQVANTEEAVAFMNGFFYFDHADIKTVMRQLEKWYDVEVSFEQPVSTRTFEGEIQRNLPLGVVLKILERNGVAFNVEGNKVIVK